MTNLTRVTADAAMLPPAVSSPACVDAETTQTPACPAWCSPDAHRHPVDVEHESNLRDLAASTVVAAGHFGEIAAQLRQDPGGGVRVALSVCTDQGDQETELTPAEALQVAYGLINAVSSARAAGSR